MSTPRASSTDADQGMLVFDFLAMDANLAHFVGQGIIVGKYSTPITVATQGFGWEKRSATDGGKTA